MALACLSAVAYIQLAGPDWKPSFLEAGYHRRVEDLLRAGDARAALEALDAATLLDEPALELLERMPSVSALSQTRSRDALLRTGIAKALASELGDPRSLSNNERDLLELATRNAELLVKLSPGAARAQLMLGLLYLQNGVDSGAPIHFMRAARHLGNALRLDPDIPGAAESLRVALARSRR